MKQGGFFCFVFVLNERNLSCAGQRGSSRGVNARGLLVEPHPGGEKDGSKGPAFRTGLEEKESRPLSSWGEGGKRKGMKARELIAAENGRGFSHVPFSW